MYRSRKPEYAQAYRGFESHPLRQKQKRPRTGPFLFLVKCGVWTKPPGSTSDTRGVSRRTPRSARRSRAGAWDDGIALRRDRHNPTRSVVAPHGAVFVSGEVRCVDEPLVRPATRSACRAGVRDYGLTLRRDRHNPTSSVTKNSNLLI